MEGHVQYLSQQVIQELSKVRWHLSPIGTLQDAQFPLNNFSSWIEVFERNTPDLSAMNVHTLAWPIWHGVS